MPRSHHQNSIKNILLPINLYGDLKILLKNIVSFLQDLSGPSHLILLNTYSVPVSSPDRVIETHDESRKRSLEKLQDVLRMTQNSSLNGKISFEAVSQMGSPANVIARFVKERDIHCVVLGRSGGLKQNEIAGLIDRISSSIFILP